MAKGKEAVSGQRVWVAMVGVNPGSANQAVFGHTEGVYFWAAGRAKSKADFTRLKRTHLERRGMSLAEVSDVMPAEQALEEKRGSEIKFDELIARAKFSAGLAVAPNLYFYEK
jgi:hypothetical protein